MMLSAGSEGVIKVWRVKGDKLSELAAFTDDRAIYRSLAFAPDGRTFAYAGGLQKTVDFTAVEGRAIKKLPHEVKHSGYVTAFSFSPDGKFFASVSDWDGVLSLRRAPFFQKQQPLRLAGHSAAVEIIRFAPNSNFIASSADDDTLRVWELSGKLEPKCQIINIKGREGSTMDLQFSKSGDEIAVCYKTRFGWEFSVLRYSRSTKKTQVTVFRRSEEWKVREAVISPDLRSVVSVDNEGIVCRWDMASGKAIKSWKLPPRVWSLTISPDGRHAVVGGERNIYFIPLPE